MTAPPHQPHQPHQPNEADEHEPTPEELAAERWFIRAGLPHFTVHYTAADDVFTRVAPLLGLVFLGELAFAFNVHFAWWWNLLAFLLGLAAVLTGVAVLNRLRGRRAFQLPDDVGPVELLAFVVLPALVPLVSGQVTQAGGVLVGNAVFLAVAYLVTSYGVVPMIGSAVRQTGRQVGDIANLMAKSLPLLLLFSVFMFINAETWTIAGNLPVPLMLISMGLLVVTGSFFVALRLPREVDRLTEAGGTFPFRRRERMNIGLLLFVGQAVQIVLVTAVIGAFYAIFGLLIIGPDTVDQWTGHLPDRIGPTVTLFGQDTYVSVELLATAGIVAAIAGLQFTVAALTDATYREEFQNEVTRELREAIARRQSYRAALAAASNAA